MTGRDTELDSPAALTAYLEALFREPKCAATEPQAAAAPPRLGTRPLQALLINAWGLELALPVESLDTILKWPPRMTHTPTRDSDRLGMMKHEDRSVPVFDLLSLLGAEQQRGAGKREDQDLWTGLHGQVDTDGRGGGEDD